MALYHVEAFDSSLTHAGPRPVMVPFAMIDPMVIGMLIFSIVEGISPLVVFLKKPVEPESSIRRLPLLLNHSSPAVVKLDNVL